jgi:hypothetical protein
VSRDLASRAGAWLLGALATVALTLSGWALSQVVAQGRDIAALEANDVNTRAALLRLEAKIDRLLDRQQER